MPNELFSKAIDSIRASDKLLPKVRPSWEQSTGLAKHYSPNIDIKKLPPPPTGGTIGNPIPLSGIGTALDIGAQVFGLSPDEDSTYGIEQSISNALLKSGNLGLMGLGTYGKATSMFNQAMNTNINTISKPQADLAGISTFQRGVNNIVGGILNSTVPGIGKLATATIDSIKSKDIDEMGGAYANTVADINIAQTMGGKNILTGGKRFNNSIKTSNQNVEDLTALNIGNKQKISSVPSNADRINQQNFNRFTGQNYQSYGMGIGKEGLKLLSKEKLLSIYNSKKDIPAYQNGGSILIPDGALHAHKHHMEDTNPELAEELTKKGIPVIVTNEDGEVTQVAEIEKEEITLSKPLTEQIEELWHKGDEDAMIKAGKIIVEALFTDCTDNADLINRVE